MMPEQESLESGLLPEGKVFEGTGHSMGANETGTMEQEGLTESEQLDMGGIAEGQFSDEGQQPPAEGELFGNGDGGSSEQPDSMHNSSYSEGEQQDSALSEGQLLGSSEEEQPTGQLNNQDSDNAGENDQNEDQMSMTTEDGASKGYSPGLGRELGQAYDKQKTLDALSELEEDSPPIRPGGTPVDPDLSSNATGSASESRSSSDSSSPSMATATTSGKRGPGGGVTDPVAGSEGKERRARILKPKGMGWIDPVEKSNMLDAAMGLLPGGPEISAPATN